MMWASHAIGDDAAQSSQQPPGDLLVHESLQASGTSDGTGSGGGQVEVPGAAIHQQSLSNEYT